MDNFDNVMTDAGVRTSLPNGGVGASEQGSRMKEYVGRTLESAAGRLRSRSDEARLRGSGLARIGSDTADGLDRVASYVRDADSQKIKSDIEQTVRRNPGRSLLIAGVAGLILGSILRRR